MFIQNMTSARLPIWVHLLKLNSESTNSRGECQICPWPAASSTFIFGFVHQLDRESVMGAASPGPYVQHRALKLLPM